MIVADSRQYMIVVHRYIYGMTFWGWQKDDIYGIELGGCPKTIENGTKSEIDKNDKGMTLVIQPRV